MSSTEPNCSLLCMCWILCNLLSSKSSVAIKISKFECSTLKLCTPSFLLRDTGSTVARSMSQVRSIFSELEFLSATYDEAVYQLI